MIGEPGGNGIRPTAGVMVEWFLSLSGIGKTKVVAIAAGFLAAIYFLPPVRGIVGALAFLATAITFFLWLGEGRPSRFRTITQVIFVATVAANVALYGRESLTVRVLSGMLQSLAGARPGCTGPAPDARCD